MNAPLRRVGVVVLILFALLFVNLNYRQAYKAEDYRTSAYNGRVQTDEYQRQRGSILLSDERTIIAESKATTDTLKYLRTYPLTTEYAHVVGYKPVNLGATGVEKWEDQYLAGLADTQIADRIIGMFTNNRSAGGNVILTVSKATQDAATKELANNKLGIKKGSAVVLDPKTGALLASVSMPSFDPNPLASHSVSTAQAAYNQLNADKDGKPLLNRGFSETYPPGSTFKVIDSAVALSNGLNPDTVLKGGESYTPPQTTVPIHNASGVNCPDQITLRQALVVSCNTAFARLCVEQLHANAVKSMAQALGYESQPRFAGDEKTNYMNVAPSHTGSITRPDGQEDPAALAQSCIGQFDVRSTPLQAALVAATVANGGSEMRPYLIDKEQAPDLSKTQIGIPRELKRPFSGQVAGQLQDMMIAEVNGGTGKSAAIPGFQVGGKTGTAENAESAGEHGWFIGFAMKDGQPIVAVAVMLENAGRGGSKEAARISGLIMRAVIAERGIK
jgi:peptidoglycan glycosyltransferase